MCFARFNARWALAFLTPALHTQAAWQTFSPEQTGNKRKADKTIGTAWLPRDATAGHCCSELRDREEREARGTSLKRGAFGCSADVCGAGQCWAASCKGSCKQAHFTAPSQHPRPAWDPSSTWDSLSSARTDTILPGISFGLSSQHVKGACMADQECQK